MIISPQILKKFCAAALMAAGAPDPEAQVMAEVLVEANLEGTDTHGISRLPVYVSSMRRGRINPAPAIACTRAAPALGHVDGDNGLGLLVAYKAMGFAMELACAAGAGFVTVKRSSHFGAATYFCKMAAEAGKIGMAFTNSPPGVPPWGGRNAYFGTNPIAMAFPGKNGRHVEVDLSTSVTARGRIIQAAKTGEPIPEGWAIDSDGKPTTDAKKALAGAVLPMAGPKGYALGLAVEILCGILTGAAYGKHVGWIYDDSLEPVNVGHAFLAVDVDPLMDLQAFTDRLEAMVEEFTHAPLADGFDAIRVPGDRKRQTAAERGQGVPVPQGVLAELDAMAKDLALASLSELAGQG